MLCSTFILLGLVSGIPAAFAFAHIHISAQELKWPGAVVPYELSHNFSPKESLTILTAMNSISTQTCVIFSPHKTEKDFLSINVQRRHHISWSAFGRTTGKQIMTLALATQNSTLQQGIILYHLMRVLGFHPEHIRPDRDEYIKINWNNIKWNKLHTFRKLSKNDFIYDTDKETYDFSSLMHYNITKFAKDPKIPAILPKKTQVDSVIGQRVGLSHGDIRKIQNGYHCAWENNKVSNFDEIISNLSYLWIILFVILAMAVFTLTLIFISFRSRHNIGDYDIDIID